MKRLRLSRRGEIAVLIAALFLAGAALGLIIVKLADPGSSGTSTTIDGVAVPATRSAASAGTPPNHAKHSLSPAAASVSASAELAPNASATFAELEHELPGPIEVAVMPVSSTSPAAVFGLDEPAHGWSTTKIPVIAALMTALRSRELSAEQSAEVRSAITESSNEAILALFHDLEGIKGGLVPASEAVEAELRESGDRLTLVPTSPPPPGAVTTFGQTEWAPSSAVLFFSALDAGCLLPADRTRLVLGLMQEIEPSESWGLGSAGFDHIAFKGGWGPEGDAYLVRQSGIVDPGTPRATAVAIIAHPPGGSDSFSAGTEMMTKTATWLHGVLHPTAHRISCS